MDKPALTLSSVYIITSKVITVVSTSLIYIFTHIVSKHWILPPDTNMKRIYNLPLKVERGHRPENFVHDVMWFTL